MLTGRMILLTPQGVPQYEEAGTSRGGESPAPRDHLAGIDLQAIGPARTTEIEIVAFVPKGCLEVDGIRIESKHHAAKAIGQRGDQRCRRSRRPVRCEEHRADAQSPEGGSAVDSLVDHRMHLDGNRVSPHRRGGVGRDDGLAGGVGATSASAVDRLSLGDSV